MTDSVFSFGRILAKQLFMLHQLLEVWLASERSWRLELRVMLWTMKITTQRTGQA